MRFSLRSFSISASPFSMKPAYRSVVYAPAREERTERRRERVGLCDDSTLLRAIALSVSPKQLEQKGLVNALYMRCFEDTPNQVNPSWKCGGIFRKPAELGQTSAASPRQYG